LRDAAKGIGVAWAGSYATPSSTYPHDSTGKHLASVNALTDSGPRTESCSEESDALYYRPARQEFWNTLASTPF
jgi:hypothetical protein